MKIEEKIYRFGTVSGNDINKDDKLVVCINGEKSTLVFNQLFIQGKYSQRSDSVKGYCFLQNCEIKENAIVYKVNEKEVLLTLFNEKTEEEIFITKTYYPVIQFSDIEISQEKTEEIEEILRFEYSSLFEQEQIVVENEIAAEIEGSEINIGETTKENIDEIIVSNGDFESDIAAFPGGIEVYESENYRFGYRPKNGQNQAVCLVAKITNEGYEKLSFETIKNTANSMVLRVSDGSQIEFNKLNNKLLITF